jgi:hypothetical protein
LILSELVIDDKAVSFDEKQPSSLYCVGAGKVDEQEERA